LVEVGDVGEVDDDNDGEFGENFEGKCEDPACACFNISTGLSAVFAKARMLDLPLLLRSTTRTRRGDDDDREESDDREDGF
jgi:hypothetical protein